MSLQLGFRTLLGVSFLALGLPSLVMADLRDAEQSQERARNAFIERFTTFTQDKNVMGKPRTPDGKVSKGGKKTRFNEDDGAPFQSDLTYHDFSFNTIDESQNQDKNNKDAKVDRLYAFVSEHGGVSAAGGSSQLERTAYGLAKQYAKQDTKEGFKRDDDEKGIKYRSIFKISTQEVTKADKNGKGEEESERVERYELRDEAKQAITKVGEESSETLIRTGRAEDQQDNPKALANGVFLRYAAGQATLAMWNSTLANLIQRRLNKGIRGGDFPTTPQLSEGVPNCENWASTAQGVVNTTKDQAERERLTKELQRMTDQCKTLASIPYNVVNPKYDRKEQGEGEELKVDGPDKEDAMIRDLRNQLEVLAKGDAKVESLPSNWKYGPDDAKARVAIDYDDSQQKSIEANLTVAEQYQSYNNLVKESAKGVEEVKSRIPGWELTPEKVLSFQKDPSKISPLEINQDPTAAFEEVGLPTPPAAKQPPPQTYTDLVQRAKQ